MVGSIELSTIFYYRCMRVVISNSQLDNILLEVISNNVVIDEQYRLLYEVLYCTGCRVNDLLEYNRWNVLMNGKVQLQPQKGNNLRIFDSSTLPAIFYDSLINNYNLFDNILYGKVEYNLLRLINKYDIRRNKKKITTHLFRHNYAKKLKEVGKTDVEIQSILGEKHLISAQNYINSQLSGYL